jgi:hypothetical protein
MGWGRGRGRGGAKHEEIGTSPQYRYRVFVSEVEVTEIGTVGLLYYRDYNYAVIYEGGAISKPLDLPSKDQLTC